MKLSRVALLLGILTAPAAAHKTCKSFKVPVSIDATELVFAPPPFKTDFDVAAFVDAATSRSPPDQSTVFSGYRNVSATYEIAATFCTPAKGGNDAHKDTILIATHGLGYDRTYWAPQIDKDLYSFVDFVVAKGYSIFYYDRVGVGKSSQASGYENQLSTQTAVLRELTAQIKAGKLIGPAERAEKVVLVGHSFGSSVSLSAVADDESLADGVVLTGFNLNTEYANTNNFLLGFQLRIAAQQRPGQWRQLDTGYLTNVDLYSNVNTFFSAPDYDPRAARYAEEHKQPLAVTEILTVGAVEVPTNYTRPVMIISGQHDFTYCTSDCDGILGIGQAAQVFAKSKDFRAVSYPGAGHGLNLHLNATGAYEQITDFLAANSL